MESDGFGESDIAAVSGETKKILLLNKTFLCRDHFHNVVTQNNNSDK